MLKYLIHSSKIFPGNAAFYLMDENGLDITIIMEMCADRGMILDWHSFFVAAHKSKNYKTVKGLERLTDKCKQAADLIWTESWWKHWDTKEPDTHKTIHIDDEGAFSFVEDPKM